ncbi:MAG TPA: hypothetical protein VJ974_01250, partial [Geopsychrobacteraceae bacterium]|nr:hypothetical protein [Geopsychrobacteraceae bacterium]
IEKPADLILEIGAASREQESGSEQIAGSIVQLDKVIQQNASSAEHLSAVAEKVSGQVDQLQKMVAVFKISEQVIKAKETAKPLQQIVERKVPEKKAVNQEPVAPSEEKGVNLSLEQNDKLDEMFEEF